MAQFLRNFRVSCKLSPFMTLISFNKEPILSRAKTATQKKVKNVGILFEH